MGGALEGVGPGSGRPREYEPVFIDMALSVVAGNRLDIYRRRNEPIPEGWALNADGEPTTDPNDMRQGGTLAPMQGTRAPGSRSCSA